MHTCTQSDHLNACRSGNKSLFLNVKIAFIVTILSSFFSPVFAQNCTFKVTLVSVSYASGQTTFKYSIQNTNYGNGYNGTCQNLTSWGFVLNSCISPSKIENGDCGYGNTGNPSCAGSASLVKWSRGTSGNTISYYSVTLNGLFTTGPMTTAYFKYGSSCCSQQIPGIAYPDPKVVSCPAGKTIECPAVPQFTTPTFSSNCDVALIITYADVKVVIACGYTLTRTWTATDPCGSKTTASQTITVSDKTPPVISGVGGPLTIECSGTPTFCSPTATDACSAATLTFADVKTTLSCGYSVTRTWTAKDVCGNTSTASQTITVTDKTPPVISGVGGPLTIECSGTPTFCSPTATDACSAATLTFADVKTTLTCGYSVTRTWTAKDACGNTSTASQTITVTDKTPPVISGVAGPLTIECSGTPTFCSPTATDACSAATLTFADVKTTLTCGYSVTRTWTAKDACGNTSTASQIITVSDKTPPVISGVGGPLTIECSGTPTFCSPTATDACSAATLTFADVKTTLTCGYSVTRTWTAKDACGNTSTASQTITVTDKTPPVISGVAGPLTIECSGTPTFCSPTATDACSAATLTYTDVKITLTCGYSVTRTWTAKDACGNTSTASQIITVIDKTAPVISGVAGPLEIECSGTPTFCSPTATDACSAATLTFADVKTTLSCGYSITRTWTAKDACGNTSTASQTITVTDKTAPVISGVGDNTDLECSGTPIFSSPTVSDACDANPSLTFADVKTTLSCGYSITRTWTAKDACGNTSTASQTVTVADKTAPVISGVGGPLEIDCSGTPVFSSPSVSDACDANPSLTFADVKTTLSCGYSITRTWTAKDACGNTSTASQTVTVADKTAPVISGVGGPQTGECSAPLVFSSPTVSDACDPNPSLTFADVKSSLSCGYSITRTWTAKDACGNTSTASQTINLTDETAPVISGVPDPAIVDCGRPILFTTPTVIDACDPNPSLTFEDVQIPLSCGFTYTRTWTAKDACGNTSTASQTFTLVDRTAPLIIGVEDSKEVECSGTPVFSSPTVYDLCDFGASLTFVDVKTTLSCGYSVTRTWTAKDACSNTSTASQTITVTDKTAPVISGVGDNTDLECSGTPVFSSPTVSDACDANPSFTFADVKTTLSCGYSITRTWTAKDACGNTSTASQTVTVADKTAPVISGVDGPLEIDCSGTPVFSSPSVTDACDADPSLTFADVKTTLSCSYSITRTWTAKDACGNTSTASQTVTVADKTAPVISGVGGPQTGECSAPLVFSSPTVSDACDPNPSLTFADVKSSLSCGYSVTRTWTAKDACGNTSTASQTITVTDKTAPVISGVAGPATIECSSSPVFCTPTVSDACDPSPLLTYTDVKTTLSCGYSITRTWTAKDACGNTSTASQTVTVTDKTPPVINGVGGPVSIECSGTPVFCSPTATDACSSATLTYADVKTTLSCGYSITRTWTAKDACGNTSTASQTITVTDKTAPVISGVAGPATIECSSSPVFCTPTVSDACDPSPLLTYTDVKTTLSCGYSITRTWTAKDACGNTSTASQTVTVTDKTPPVINGVGGPVSIECSGTPVFCSPTATDACSSATLTYADVKTTLSCGYSITRTWTAKDACGNTSTASQTVTVTDKTPPVINGVGGPVSIECSGTPVFCSPTATDACSSATLTYADVKTTLSCGYSITRTWTAKDACGNTSTASQTVTVTDKTPPVISGVGGPVSIECSGTPVFCSPTATDACSSATLTYADVKTTLTCGYSVKRTWTAKDACGNTSMASQTITVTDKTAPVLSCVADKKVPCGSSVVFDQPKATDACDPNPTINVICTVVNGNVHTRTWQAVDACGNKSATGNQSVTVLSCGHYSSRAAEKPKVEQPVTLSVSAYPNPYHEKVKFVIQSPVSGKGTLDVYNSIGQKIKTVYEGEVFAGKSQTVDFAVPAGQTNLIYIFHIGDSRVTGKLLKF